MRKEINKLDNFKNVVILVLSILGAIYITYFVVYDKLTQNSSIFRTVGALNNLDDITKGNISEITFRESVLIYSVITNIDLESLEAYRVLCPSFSSGIYHQIIDSVESKTKLTINQTTNFKKKYESIKKFCQKSKI
jgi:hypothetical protein